MIVEEWKNTENEKKQILEVTEKVFPNSEFSTSEYYDWQYRKCPYGITKIFLAKDENEKIIGMEPIIPMKLLIDKKTVLSSLSCNSVVDPDFRNQGVFSNLVSNVIEFVNRDKISSIYGIPNTKSHQIFLKNGFLDIGELPLLFRPLKISNYFSSPIKEIIKPFDTLWKIKNRKTKIELFEDEINLDFEKIISNLAKRISILQKRDKEFLEWRYRNHPSRKYKIHVLKENTEIQGYIISRISNFNGKKIGIILDFVINSDTEYKKGGKDLVKKVLEIFWDEDVSISIATCNSTSIENQILHQVGFKTSPKFLKPEPLHFIIGGINSENLENIKEFKNWFFTLGDYDVF